MLIKLNGTNETKRVQCPWVSEEEVQAVTDFLRSQGEPVYDENILKPRDDEAAEDDDDGETDPMYDAAVQIVAETRRCSTSWLQRKLQLGYNRAARIVGPRAASSIEGIVNLDAARTPLWWRRRTVETGTSKLSCRRMAKHSDCAILKWIVADGIGSALSDPGKPWQNGTDESFNGKFRDECLSTEYFRSRQGRLRRSRPGGSTRPSRGRSISPRRRTSRWSFVSPTRAVASPGVTVSMDGNRVGDVSFLASDDWNNWSVDAYVATRIESGHHANRAVVPALRRRSGPRRPPHARQQRRGGGPARRRRDVREGDRYRYWRRPRPLTSG
jgi:hypothetical protein